MKETEIDVNRPKPGRPYRLNLPREAYQPGSITIRKVISYDEGMAEYQRLRGAIMKRFNRLEHTRFADSAIIARGKKTLVTPAKVESPSHLSALLAESRWILQSPLSTVRGQEIVEYDTLKRLHEKHHYDFVNKDNLREFGNFMEAMRVKNAGKLPQSGQIAQLYDSATKKQIPLKDIIEHFEFWQANVEELEKSRETQARGGPSEEVYRSNIQHRLRRHALKNKG